MLDFLTQPIVKLAEKVLAVLPDDPFEQFLVIDTDIAGFMGKLNWFVPVGVIVDITLAWLACVLIFKKFSMLMRWIKLIH